MIQAGVCVRGESGRKYRLLSPLSKYPSNVWKAADIEDETLEHVVKAPSYHDEASLDWPLLRHETQMQRHFDKSPMIRQMTDTMPHSDSSPPMAVLQMFEESLWTARNRRPFALPKIKWIMKAVLLGLWTIPREDLVYSNLKMENVMLNGFEDNAPGEVRSIVARLADCGAITKPSSREVTSIAYRSPEVYFGRPWSSSTDIWSWGIVYCHLLEARADISSPGVYDSICKGTMGEKAKSVRDAMVRDFSLQSIPFFTEDPHRCKLLPSEPTLQSEDDWWCDRLLRKGVPEEEIAFLIEVLVPDPTERLNAEEIIRSGYLDEGEMN